nr:hypothetical protein BaRGS_021001 [Batillaria attramentaria]
MNQPGWDGGQHGPLIHGANGQGWGPLAGVPLHVLQQPGLLPTPQNPFMMAQAPAAPLNMKKNNKRKAADMEETGPKRKAYKQESAGGSGLASCMALAGGGAPGLGGAGLFPPGISFEGSLVGVPQNPMSQFYEGQALFQQGHGLHVSFM